jgi:hypothetical protein
MQPVHRGKGLLGSMLLLMAYVVLVLNTNSVSSDQTPNNGPFSTKAVCRHIINDFGWHGCRTDDCLDQQYLDWPIWNALQQQCTTQCRSVTFGHACEYGDVYAIGRSGINVGFDCQCSGRSSETICTQRRSKIKDIASDIRGRSKGMFNRARRACASFCSSLRPGTMNNDHCSNSVITPQDLLIPGSTPPPSLETKKKKKKKAQRVPSFDNWTCICVGDKTGEDSGEVEGPESG